MTLSTGGTMDWYLLQEVALESIIGKSRKLKRIAKKYGMGNLKSVLKKVDAYLSLDESSRYLMEIIGSEMLLYYLSGLFLATLVDTYFAFAIKDPLAAYSLNGVVLSGIPLSCYIQTYPRSLREIQEGLYSKLENELSPEETKIFHTLTKRRNIVTLITALIQLKISKIPESSKGTYVEKVFSTLREYMTEEEKREYTSQIRRIPFARYRYNRVWEETKPYIEIALKRAEENGEDVNELKVGLGIVLDSIFPKYVNSGGCATCLACLLSDPGRWCKECTYRSFLLTQPLELNMKVVYARVADLLMNETLPWSTYIRYADDFKDLLREYETEELAKVVKEYAPRKEVGSWLAKRIFLHLTKFPYVATIICGWITPIYFAGGDVLLSSLAAGWSANSVFLAKTLHKLAVINIREDLERILVESEEDPQKQKLLKEFARHPMPFYSWVESTRKREAEMERRFKYLLR